MPKKIAALAAALLPVAGLCRLRRRIAVAQFYRGKTVTIIVGSSAGGGYDTYARLMARFFSKHMPGNPTVVLQNMPGAGSNLMSAYVANVAPKDGTVIGANFAGYHSRSAYRTESRREITIRASSTISAAPTTMFSCASRAPTRRSRHSPTLSRMS